MIEFIVIAVLVISWLASGNSVRLGVEAQQPANNTPEREQEANWSLLICIVCGIVGGVVVLAGMVQP